MGNIFDGLNIRQKIMAFTGLICVVFLIVLGIVFYRMVVSQTKAQLETEVATEAAQLDASVRAYLNFMGADIKQMAAEYDLRQGGNLTVYPEQVAEVGGVVPMVPEQKGGFELSLWQKFGRYTQSHGTWVHAVTYGMEDGGYVQYPAAAREVSYDPRRLYWFQEVKSKPDKLFVGSAFRSADGRALVGVYTAVRGYDEELDGVLGVQVDLAAVLKHLGAPEDMLILNPDGVIIAAGQKDILFRPVTEADLGDLSLLKAEDRDFRRIMFNGSEKYAGVYTSPDTHLKYIFLLPPERVTAAAGNLRLALVGLILLCLAVAAWAVRYLAAMITDPFKGIETAAEAIGAGNLTVAESLAEQDDEVGRLSSAFQEMSERLQEKLVPVKQNAADIGTVSGKLGENAAAALADAAQIRQTAAQMGEVGQKQRQTVAEIAAQLHSLSESMQSVLTADDALRQGVKAIIQAVEQDAKEAQTEQTPEKLIPPAAVTALEREAGEALAIVGEINSMAEQVNLLALNAAVEAARHNKEEKSKFAAVAEDIRKLAENSGNAAQKALQNLGALQSSAATLAQTARDIETSLTRGQASRQGGHLSEVSDQAAKLSAALDNLASGIKAVGQSKKMLDEAILQIEWENRKADDAATAAKEQLERHGVSLRELSEQAAAIKDNADTMQKKIETFVLS